LFFKFFKTLARHADCLLWIIENSGFILHIGSPGLGLSSLKPSAAVKLLSLEGSLDPHQQLSP
jgi:hypothetical protein